MSTEQLQHANCPSCSAAVDPNQEYCVDCGSRLPQERPAKLVRTTVGAGRDPRSAGWIVPALLGLVVAILGTGAALAISDDAQPEAAPPTATGGSLTITRALETLTPPEPPATTPAPAPRPARPAVPRAIVWPPRRRGWTIVLLSMPQNSGRAAAAERAEVARRGGLRRVGVLNSSHFASLHPGYYVVFQGVFDSEAEATSVVRRARSVFRPAYVREIVP